MTPRSARRSSRAFARHFWPALALLPAVVLLAPGCARDARSEGREAPVAVRVAPLAPASEAATVEAVGSLKAVREATISGKVMGTVTEIRKHAGDVVRQGEILITIDARDVSGQIAQAEGALAQAKAAAVLAETNFHRFEQLHDRGSASQLELDQARYQYETTRGAVEQAEGAVGTATSYRSYAEIPAPFSGRIIDQLCEVGDLAAPGRPLMRIEDPDHLRLIASLDASKAGAAVVGEAIDVRVPSLGGRTLGGRIAEVVPAADPATRSILVKIDMVPDPSLRSGLFGSALIPVGTREVLRVPRSSVVERGGLTGVFVAESGRAAFRMVVAEGLDSAAGHRPVTSSGSAAGLDSAAGARSATGPDSAAGHTGSPARPAQGNGIEIVSGLSAGDQVILDPPTGLEINQLIEVRP
jgi:multidrug efflux system membrane fusion protein